MISTNETTFSIIGTSQEPIKDQKKENHLPTEVHYNRNHALVNTVSLASDLKTSFAKDRRYTSEKAKFPNEEVCTTLPAYIPLIETLRIQISRYNIDIRIIERIVFSACRRMVFYSSRLMHRDAYGKNHAEQSMMVFKSSVKPSSPSLDGIKMEARSLDQKIRLYLSWCESITDLMKIVSSGSNDDGNVHVFSYHKDFHFNAYFDFTISDGIEAKICYPKSTSNFEQFQDIFSNGDRSNIMIGEAKDGSMLLSLKNKQDIFHALACLLNINLCAYVDGEIVDVMFVPEIISSIPLAGLRKYKIHCSPVAYSPCTFWIQTSILESDFPFSAIVPLLGDLRENLNVAVKCTFEHRNDDASFVYHGHSLIKELSIPSDPPREYNIMYK